MRGSTLFRTIRLGVSSLLLHKLRSSLTMLGVLFGVAPVIDSTSGCGDCVRAYRGGMPAFSFSGSVVDYNDGRHEVRRGSVTTSATRLASASHDVTESAEIVRLWAGVKQALLFAVAYAGPGG